MDVSPLYGTEKIIPPFLMFQIADLGSTLTFVDKTV